MSMSNKLVLVISITLSTAFGLLLLAVAAEVLYLLCWKKRRTNAAATEIDHHRGTINNDVKGSVSNTEPDLEIGTNNNDVEGSVNNNTEPDMELGTNNCNENNDDLEEAFQEAFKRLYNLAGPPRYLFTIKEETEEDLESEDGKYKCDDIVIASRKGSRSRSLSLSSLDSYMHQGFNNPLFESELIKFRSSPPPKFKFLRDAEEKWFRRLIEEEEAQRRAQMSIASEPKSRVQVQQHIITQVSSC